MKLTQTAQNNYNNIHFTEKFRVRKNPVPG